MNCFLNQQKGVGHHASACPPEARWQVHHRSHGHAMMVALKPCLENAFVAYRFTWIIPGSLAGMAMPGHFQPIEADLDDLAVEGIRHIVTLTEAGIAIPIGEGFINHHLPIADFGAPDVNQAAAFCRLVDEVRGKQGGVVVHCLAGIGRTGTMLAAYLMWDQGLNAHQALTRVRGMRREYVQSVEQEAFLEHWALHLMHAREES